MTAADLRAAPAKPKRATKLKPINVRPDGLPLIRPGTRVAIRLGDGRTENGTIVRDHPSWKREADRWTRMADWRTVRFDGAGTVMVHMDEMVAL
jgi:hypothetical protein